MNIGVKMIVKLLIPFLLLQVVHVKPKELQCQTARSKICHLDDVIWQGTEMSQFPDLSDKHTLIIRSGNIGNFSENLAAQIGAVTKLQLRQLKIQSLYISPKWISLKADSNQIYELHVEPSEDETLEVPDIGGEDDATAVPYDSQTANELRYLNLAHNRLQSVKKLKHFVQLEEINLDVNLIELIEMDTFNGMDKLKKLSLANNQITEVTTLNQVNLPALEQLTFAFNQLAELKILDWVMLQLSHLDISHNNLIRMDAPSIGQFVSLESLAMGNNSWHCDWLSGALKNIRSYYVQLEDAKESCPQDHFLVEGYCCNYQHVEEDSVSVQEKMKRIEEGTGALKKDLTEKLKSYEAGWTEEYAVLQQKADAKMSAYKKLEAQMHNDDNKQAKAAVEDFSKLIKDCQELLDKIKTENNKNKHYVTKYTNLFYTALAEKNKLIQEMGKAAKLEEEIKKYETSYRKNNGL